MAVTLAQAKLKTQDKLSMAVIDEFRKSSFLLDHMVFDDCVSPAGRGATMTYGYYRVITPSTAGFRAVNEEYSASEAKKQKYTTDLKIFGGSFEIDRVIADMGGVDDGTGRKSGLHRRESQNDRQDPRMCTKGRYVPGNQE